MKTTISQHASKDVAKKILLKDIRILNLKIEQIRARINQLYEKERKLQEEVFKLAETYTTL